MLSCALLFSAASFISQREVQAAGETYTFTDEELSVDPCRVINAKIWDVKGSATASSPYTLKLPSGGKTYSITSLIKLYSNITLDLNGATLKEIPTGSGQAHNVIRLGEDGDGVRGYLHSNIKVTNGTIDGNHLGATVLKIAHGKNITFSDLTVMNTKDFHLSEFAAIDGLTITNCTFKDMVWANNWKKNNDSCFEAIQLDVLTPYHFDYYEYEALPMKNVKITDCTFTNVPRAIGCHTSIVNAPFNNITITGNTITGCKSAAIQGCYWSNVTIKDNTIKDCPRGIAIYSVNGSGGETSSASGSFLASDIDSTWEGTPSIPSDYREPGDMKISITDNKITLNADSDLTSYQNAGIMVGGINYKSEKKNAEDSSGAIPTGNYYLNGVTIKDNTITTSGFGIRTWDSRNVTISGNSINGSKSSLATDHGISCDGESENITITSNTVKNMAGDGIQIKKSEDVSVKSNTVAQVSSIGIRVNDGSKVKALESNKISKTSSTGILLSGSASAPSIKNNTISDSGDAGIKISNSSQCSDITSNTVKNSAKSGIAVSSSGSVNGDIASNTVSGSGSNAIYVTDSCKVSSVTGNTVTNTTGDHAIFLTGGAKISGSVTDNTVDTVTKNGIYVSSGVNMTGVINNNKVTSAGEAGIKVSNAGTSVKEIRGNTVDKSGTNGIMINDGAKLTGDIISNTVTTSGKHGISVSDSGTSVANIKSNKVDGTKVVGVIVSLSASVTSVTSNNVNNAGDAGIKICEKASANIISDNQVDSPLTNGIAVSTDGMVLTAIRSNQISSPSANGIAISDRGTCSDIGTNTIKNAKINGIFVLKGAKITGTISSNTITSPSESGIKISNSDSSATKILSNKIASAKQNGIVISDSAKISDSIASNQITSAGKTGILLSTNAQVKDLSKNIIDAAGENGIKLYDNSTVAKDITGNKITDPKAMGIVLVTRSKVTGNISDNTINNSGNVSIKISDRSKAKNITSNRISYSKGASSILVSSASSVNTIKSNSITFPTNKDIAVKVDSKSSVTTNSGNSVFRFTDVVNVNDFWFKPTYSLANKGVVKGYDNQTKFKPANNCTRAQMVTFLWRLSGCPVPKAKTCKFSDVKASDYFYKAVIWGNENGIVEGYKDGTFGPQIVCMRKHAVTFMWRMAGKPKPSTKKNKFSDVKMNDYFYMATLWAAEKNILAGYPDGTFKPNGKCLRRQMVTFLDKYNNNVK